MKTILIAASAACALLAVPAMAQAEVQWSADVGYTNVNVDELDANLGVVTGRVTAMFTPNFGVEGELGFGVGDDTVDFGGFDVKVELKNIAAGYVVLNWPVSDKFDVYARAGYANLEVEASVAGGGSASESGSDSAVGFGVKGYFAGNNGVRADWTNYGGTDSFSIAYVRKF